MTANQLRYDPPSGPREVGLPLVQYTPKVITCPEEARSYVAPVYDFCGWCFRSRPQFTKCTCGIAERVAKEKRKAAAQGRVPHFGPRYGDPIICPDCSFRGYSGGSHDCPGPKHEKNPFSVETINDQSRRAGLLNDLRELGLLDEAGDQ